MELEQYAWKKIVDGSRGHFLPNNANVCKEGIKMQKLQHEWGWYSHHQGQAGSLQDLDI